MRIDITSMFFNSKIEGKTATPPWGTSIGQSKLKDCRIEDDKEGVTDMIIGMTYKSKTDRDKLDISSGSANRELLLFSVFTKVYINGIQLKDAQYTLILVKEQSKYHNGRLIISYAPYIKYDNISNEVAIEQMRQAIGCSENGCWFVYDISIIEQDQLHFSAIIVDKNNAKIYKGTSQERSLEWKSLTENRQASTARKYKILKEEFDNKFINALQTKPFMLLAGISGTGKSRIVREMAYLTCPEELQDKDETNPGNYCIIEVKPNWHDSSELIGYYSNIRGKYVFTPFIKFLIKAMKYPQVPFFVCLDEMNLAPVEQYFAEFLSVLETRKFNDSTNKILTCPIIKNDFFKPLSNIGSSLEYTFNDNNKYNHQLLAYDIAYDLDLSNNDYESIRIDLINKGLILPDNVFIIGTVNMDDTTYKFSRKVIDRAMTIEMNGGKLHEMFGNSSQLKYRKDENIASLYAFKPKYVTADDAISNCLNMQEYIIQVIGSEENQNSVSGRLKAINDCLEGTPFKVSYRVLNELVIYLAVLLDNEEEEVSEKRFEEILNTAIDDITLMKILPRIEGDYEMFECRDTNGAMMDENKLEKLMKVVPPYGKSYNKIIEMNNRLNKSSFTRFWP